MSVRTVRLDEAEQALAYIVHTTGLSVSAPSAGTLGTA